MYQNSNIKKKMRLSKYLILGGVLVLLSYGCESTGGDEPETDVQVSDKIFNVIKFEDY